MLALPAPPATEATPPWKIGQGPPPGQYSTAVFYEQLGQSIGAPDVMAAVGAHVIKTWMAPLIEDHLENVTDAALRRSLAECGVDQDQIPSYVKSICKYIGANTLKSAQLPSQVVREGKPSNVKKAQQDRRSLGHELGVEGLKHVRQKGLDGISWPVQPTTKPLNQTKITLLKNAARKFCMVRFQNVYGDVEFFEALGEYMSKQWPNFKPRKNKPDREWSGILFNGFENGKKASVRATH